MANELLFTDPSNQAHEDYYAVLEQGAKIVVVSSGALATRNSGSWASAVIALSDSVAAGRYLANIPANVAAGKYEFNVYQKLGDPADLNDPLIASQEGGFFWDGTIEVNQIADGFSYRRIFRALAALLAGKGPHVDNGNGTATQKYLAADATTIAIQNTYDTTTGARAAAGTLL